MKQIEEFIQFAIENGYEKLTPYRISRLTTYPKGKAFIYIITSKPFIEAIDKGLQDLKYKKAELEWYSICRTACVEINRAATMNRIDELTKNQAIAIRDNKLEEFITNILPWNTNQK